MQDGLNELLHLGDLATLSAEFEQDRITAHSILAEEDLMLIKQVSPTEIQEWCLARIAGHRGHSRLLRELYGPAAHTAICNTKSHIRALRSEHNAFAPINHLLPPEVLMEIFSNVHPAVVHQRRVPVLHVCRYWRMIVLKTPQFWANLLSLPMLHSMNPKWRIGRFTAALARSAPMSLTLSLPFWSLDVAALLVPHASRLASLTIRPTPGSDIEDIKRLLEQHMPRLTDLVILDSSQYWGHSEAPLTLYFHLYPNIRSLRLGLTLSYDPAVPCASLHHLELRRCTMRACPTSSYASSIHAVHDALELFPNLETLTLTHALLEENLFEDIPELTKTVHLPRLSRLEIKDMPINIPSFLSHLVFPSTTSLALEPDNRLAFEEPMIVPVFPGMMPSPVPGAELSLDFNLRGPVQLARWETHGEGTRPVCVTVSHVARRLATVAHLTRELAQAFACTVTAMTVRGTWMGSSGNHPHNALEYWTAFLPDLAGLRRLTCATGGASDDFVRLLGRPLLPSAGSPGEPDFPCTGLEDLALVWALPFNAYLELVSGRGSRASAEYAASLAMFCNALRACLAERITVGRCVPIRKLSVALPRSYGRSMELQRWQAVLVTMEQDLRGWLGRLVEEVAVVTKID